LGSAKTHYAVLRKSRTLHQQQLATGGQQLLRPFPAPFSCASSHVVWSSQSSPQIRARGADSYSVGLSTNVARHISGVSPTRFEASFMGACDHLNTNDAMAIIEQAKGERLLSKAQNAQAEVTKYIVA